MGPIQLNKAEDHKAEATYLAPQACLRVAPVSFQALRSKLDTTCICVRANNRV